MIRLSFFLFLTGLLGFFPSKAEAIRLDPESHAALSNPRYAKHIEVRCYLVTREQFGKLFSQKDGLVTQLPNDKLRPYELYLLVRCKNKGNHAAFGDLHCFISNRGSPIPIDISDLSGNMTIYHDSVIYIGKGLIDDENGLPQVKYEWDCLYTM